MVWPCETMYERMNTGDTYMHMYVGMNMCVTSECQYCF